MGSALVPAEAREQGLAAVSAAAITDVAVQASKLSAIRRLVCTHVPLLSKLRIWRRGVTRYCPGGAGMGSTAGKTTRRSSAARC